MFRYYFISVTSVLIFLLCKIPTLAEIKKPENVVENYIDAVVAGDWKRAENYWSPHEIKKSNRLGIKYSYLNIKYDTDSPLLIYLDFIRAGKMSITIKKTKEFTEYSVVTIQLTTANESIDFNYYLISANNKWLISSPIYLFTKNWKSIQTDYTNVLFSDSTLTNTYALNDVDQYIEKIGDLLKIPLDKMKKLESNKIDYFLCNKEEMILLTGYDVNGVSNLQFDAIISRHLPHPHELVHLLINYSLEELPLYTLPVLQEGLAVALGGRWGKSPEVVMQLSPIIISEKICKLDDLLTLAGFNKIIPDISYPVSGVLSKMLIANYGMDCYKKIYMLLSGSTDKIAGLTNIEIVNIIEQTCETNWLTINSDFLNYLKQFEFNDLKPGTSGGGEFISMLIGENTSITVYETDDTYEFIVQSDIVVPAGLILINFQRHPVSATYRSNLFSEQFPNHEYSGYEYGIKFDVNEVGLYNYLTNSLEAKYVAAFSPEKYYRDEKSSTIRFNLKKSAIDIELQSKNMTLIEPPTP